MNNNKISSRQMIFMLSIFRVAMSLSYLPSIEFPPYNQDTWIIVILSSLYAILFAIPLLFLTNKFNSYNMIECFFIVLGKWVGKLFVIVYGIYFFIYTIYLVVLENQLIAVSLLPATPNWVIVSMLLVFSLYLISKGLISIFWSGEFLATISFIGIIILLVLGLKTMDINVLRPILKDSSLKELNSGSFLASLIFLDIFLLTMGGKFLEDKRQINKIYIKSIIYSILFVVTSKIVIQTSLGIEQAKHSIYPFLVYTRLIKYNSILERIDVIYVTTWISAHSSKIAVYLLFSFMCFKNVFNINGKEKMVPTIMAILIGIVSVIISYDKVMGVSKIILQGVLYIPFIFTTIIPVFICIVYLFRRKTLKKYTIEEKQM